MKDSLIFPDRAVEVLVQGHEFRSDLGATSFLGSTALMLRSIVIRRYGLQLDGILLLQQASEFRWDTL